MNEQAAAPPTVNYWLVEVSDDLSPNETLMIRLADYADVLMTDDIAFLRNPDESGRAAIVGWAECRPTTDVDGRRSLSLVPRSWPPDFGIRLEETPELWSLSFRRAPDHTIHGMSGREASILLHLATVADPDLPPAPTPDGRSGTLDELMARVQLVAGLVPSKERSEFAAGAEGFAAENDGVLIPGLLLAGAAHPEDHPSAAVAAAVLERLVKDVDIRLPRAAFLGATRKDVWSTARDVQAIAFVQEDLDLIAMTDLLARQLPLGSAATDAHLLVAWLARKVPRLSADDRRLIDALIPDITADLPADRAGDWWVAVGLPPDSPVVAAIAPDSTEGKDRLDRMPDVRAFANAIASRTLAPPLSIGIFGDWGAGKTFFMRKLRNEIDRINARVLEIPREERIGYCERIAQVEFNAWHYADTELWPSLVHHLLGHLTVGTADEGEKLRAKLLDELLMAEVDVAAKEAALEVAESVVEAAESDVRVARESRIAAERQVIEVSGRDAWDSVIDAAGVRALVDRLRERFGESPAAQGAAELFDAVNETIRVVQSGRNAFRFNTADSGVKGFQPANVAVVVVVAVGAMTAAWALEAVANAPMVAGLVAAGGVVGSAAKAVSDWLTAQNARADEVVKRLSEARDQLRARHDSETASLRQAEAEAKSAVVEMRREQSIAEDALAAAKQRRDDAQEALDASKPDRRLADFVQSRIESYGSHLGLVAAVRQDFELLRGLIAEVRRDADYVRHLVPLPDGMTMPTSPIDDGDNRVAVDRIVVYIDDLDRCRPQIVVRVLEAVHLLLAFDFIVVVVGVDVRWVGRSLLDIYPNMLGGYATDHKPDQPDVRTSGTDEGPKPRASGSAGPPSSNSSMPELPQRAASEHDYIEKIFQVPYWLEPLRADAIGDLVEDLVGPVTVLAAGGAEPVAVGGDRMVGPTATIEFEVSDDGKAAIERLTERLADSTGFNPNPAGLQLTDREFDFIDVVYPLLSRSPRSAKRFVNVYRIIRAGLTSDELQSWVSASNEPQPCHAVILLLAIVCGAPQSSTGVLRRLAHLDAKADWEQLADAITEEMNDRPDERRLWSETRRIYEGTDSEPPQPAWQPISAADVTPWVGRVARYSFRSGHLDVVSAPMTGPARRS